MILFRAIRRGWTGGGGVEKREEGEKGNEKKK